MMVPEDKATRGRTKSRLPCFPENKDSTER